MASNAHKRERLEAIGRELLSIVDPDPARPGLENTPARWARWWIEFTEHDPGNMDTVFESIRADQLVLVSGIKVWSLCEHHLLPFWCDVAIGYVVRDKVIGLSKLARIAHHYAHRLQVQERLVEQIAERVSATTGSKDVAVVARGEHLCMTMRGARTPALMLSSAMHGVFRHDGMARAEILALLPR